MVVQVSTEHCVGPGMIVSYSWLRVTSLSRAKPALSWLERVEESVVG